MLFIVMFFYPLSELKIKCYFRVESLIWFDLSKKMLNRSKENKLSFKSDIEQESPPA